MEASYSYLSSCKIPWRKTDSMVLQCRSRGRNNSRVVRAGRDASGRDHDDGKLVDENMIVLRLRIKEMKMLEMNNQDQPSNWMGWEKKYYAHYDEDVCNAIGLLQCYLMDIRPSIALGMVALVALSVPISSAMVLFHVLEIGKRVLSCFN